MIIRVVLSGLLVYCFSYLKEGDKLFCIFKILFLKIMRVRYNVKGLIDW